MFKKKFLYDEKSFLEVLSFEAALSAFLLRRVDILPFRSLKGPPAPAKNIPLALNLLSGYFYLIVFLWFVCLCHFIQCLFVNFSVFSVTPVQRAIYKTVFICNER